MTQSCRASWLPSTSTGASTKRPRHVAAAERCAAEVQSRPHSALFIIFLFCIDWRCSRLDTGDSRCRQESRRHAAMIDLVHITDMCSKHSALQSGYADWIPGCALQRQCASTYFQRVFTHRDKCSKRPESAGCREAGQGEQGQEGPGQGQNSNLGAGGRCKDAQRHAGGGAIEVPDDLIDYDLQCQKHQSPGPGMPLLFQSIFST